MCVQVRLDVLGEEARQRLAGRQICREGGLLVAMRPAAEAFPELLGPAEEGAQRFQRERRRKGVGELGLAIPT
jgi:hypothetical protein